jgi:hypothetical protein
VSDDRSHLIQLGWRVIKRHPLDGAGLSGLPKAAVAGTAHPFRVKGAASHTTPVTVAAETGFPGVLLYGWLLAAALVFAFRRFARDLPGLVALALGLVVAAIAVHSLFYSAFFEDPTVWAAIGLAAALPRRRDEGADPPQLDRQVEPEREQDQRVDGAEQDGAGQRDVEALPEHR